MVSLMITYSIQKRCFLQEFITVRVCNSHMVSIPTILSCPDGGYRDHRGVVHSYDYELLLFFSVCPSTKQKTYCSFRTKSACMYSFSLGPLYIINLIHMMKYAIPSLASHSQVPGYSAYETLHYWRCRQFLV